MSRPARRSDSRFGSLAYSAHTDSVDTCPPIQLTPIHPFSSHLFAYSVDTYSPIQLTPIQLTPIHLFS